MERPRFRGRAARSGRGLRLPVLGLAAALAILAAAALLLRGRGELAPSLAPLAMVPVLWLAVYGRRWMVVGATATVVAVLLAPPVAGWRPSPDAEWRHVVLWIAVATAAALTLHVQVGRARTRERELDQARELSDAVVDTAGALVVVLDREGRIERWNPMCAWATGYEAEEVVGRRFHDFLIAPEEADGVAAALARVQAGDFPLNHENAWIARDGSHRVIAWSNTALLDDDGEVTHIVSMGLDLSEQRAVRDAVVRNEALLRAVMAAATEDAILATDPDGTLTLFNAGAERMLGHAAADVVGRLTPVAFHDGAELAEHAAELGLAAGFPVLVARAREGRPDSREWTYVRGDGERLTAMVCYSPMLDDADELVGYIGVAHDVTEQRRHEDALRRSERDLAAVLDVTRELGRTDDVRRVVVDALALVTGADVVQLLEPGEPGSLVQTAAIGVDLEALRIPLDSPSSGAVEVYTTGMRRVVADAAAEARLSPEVVADAEVRSLLFEPVAVGRRLLGVLVLGWRSEQATSADPSVVALLAAEAAVAIERADLLRRLDRQATTDALTGVPNRRALDEALLAADAGAGELSVVMLDLDHFKRFNDEHGHPAGDRLLKSCAAAWRAQLRPGDLLARYGGEEFAVLLGGCPADRAGDVAERLRAAVPGSATCSVGVASRRGAEPAAAVLRRADQALYAAKRAGRDRVMAAA